MQLPADPNERTMFFRRWWGERRAIWVTARGEEFVIEDMEDEHIEACLDMLTDVLRLQPGVWYPIINSLTSELDRRRNT